jgi:hypothetical protein
MGDNCIYIGKKYENSVATPISYARLVDCLSHLHVPAPRRLVRSLSAAPRQRPVSPRPPLCERFRYHRAHATGRGEASDGSQAHESTAAYVQWVPECVCAEWVGVGGCVEFSSVGVHQIIINVVFQMRREFLLCHDFNFGILVSPPDFFLSHGFW